MNWFYRVNGQVITRVEHALCIYWRLLWPPCFSFLHPPKNTNRCPHWQDSVLIRLPIFRRNQVRHRQNTPDSFGTAWILPPARAINRQSSPTKHSAPLTAMLLGPLQKLYWASGLLPAHSAPPLFKIWEESSQIRFKYISQRCDPTIPIMPSTPTSSIAYISNALSKGLGMCSLPPQKELVTQSQ